MALSVHFWHSIRLSAHEGVPAGEFIRNSITIFIKKNGEFIRNIMFSLKVVWELVFEGVTRFGHHHFVVVEYYGA